MDRPSLRDLPQVGELLRRPDVRSIEAPRWAVVDAIRGEVDRLRRALQAGDDPRLEVSAEAVASRARALARRPLRRVLNATGVILHTNLGRAPLAPEALAAVAEVGRGYTDLEYDLERGGRGSRHTHLAPLLCRLCGCEDAVVVNNNAGAVMLAAAALAAGRQVVVSRGELVEIGGSFRIPDVLEASGADLVEVGTTNKTRESDYERAIGERTAMALKVHPSNFRVVGFTEDVSPRALAALARGRGVWSMMDLGSGSLLSAEALSAIGLPHEPSVPDAVSSGVDLVALSGDKLLGGPQAGILVGRRHAVAAARAHPLMRALRPDKMTIAALAATLALYRDRGPGAVPAVAMLSVSEDALRARAEALLAAAGDLGEVSAEVAPCASTVGGGALPGAALRSWAVKLSSPGGADALAARLRSAPVPVVARVEDAAVWLDVRTLADEDVAEAAESLAGAARPSGG